MDKCSWKRENTLSLDVLTLSAISLNFTFQSSKRIVPQFWLPEHSAFIRLCLKSANHPQNYLFDRQHAATTLSNANADFERYLISSSGHSWINIFQIRIQIQIQFKIFRLF